MCETKFTTWNEVTTLVRQFENGSLTAEDWHHREHLTLAFWYLSCLDEARALERLRAGLLYLNERQGTPKTEGRGYHETLTRFWISVVAKYLREQESKESDLDSLNGLLDRYASKRDLWRDYYSFDLLLSARSRENWVEPDASV
jgi:hypothetical protein